MPRRKEILSLVGMAAVQFAFELLLIVLARRLGLPKRFVPPLVVLAAGATVYWFVRVLIRSKQPDPSALRIETDLFEHREVKPHFINPCCFGEDFAHWLRSELSKAPEGGFRFSEPWQEDWGWGFEATRGRDCFYVTLHYQEDGPVEHPAHWAVWVEPCRAWLPLRDVFGRIDRAALERLRDRTWQILRTTAAIRVLGHG
jgi:hypothetical protein